MEPSGTVGKGRKSPEKSGNGDTLADLRRARNALIFNGK
jgi:hypothetical protein